MGSWQYTGIKQVNIKIELQIVICCEAKEKSPVKPSLDWEVRGGLDTVGFKLILYESEKAKQTKSKERVIARAEGLRQEWF